MIILRFVKLRSGAKVWCLRLHSWPIVPQWYFQPLYSMGRRCNSIISLNLRFTIVFWSFASTLIILLLNGCCFSNLLFIVVCDFVLLWKSLRRCQKCALFVTFTSPFTRGLTLLVLLRRHYYLSQAVGFYSLYIFCVSLLWLLLVMYLSMISVIWVLLLLLLMGYNSISFHNCL